MMRPCLRCGEPTEETRCLDCTQPAIDYRPQATARGYDGSWTKLSLKARKLQPFCSDCGTQDNLTADHTPQAWERKARHLPIRLQDIDVVCGPCNNRRGPARPGTTRATQANLDPRGGTPEPGGFDLQGEAKFRSHLTIQPFPLKVQP